jgi:hypothetical protein
VPKGVSEAEKVASFSQVPEDQGDPYMPLIDEIMNRKQERNMAQFLLAMGGGMMAPVGSHNGVPIYSQSSVAALGQGMTAAAPILGQMDKMKQDTEGMKLRAGMEGSRIYQSSQDRKEARKDRISREKMDRELRIALQAGSGASKMLDDLYQSELAGVVVDGKPGAGMMNPSMPIMQDGKQTTVGEIAMERALKRFHQARESMLGGGGAAGSAPKKRGKAQRKAGGDLGSFVGAI